MIADAISVGTIVSMLACPFCSTARETRSFLRAKSSRAAGDFFSIDRCGQCGLLFTSDAPDAMSIEKYYDDKGYVPHQEDLPFVFRLIRTVRDMGKCRFLPVQRGKLVDIGCGNGGFLMAAKRRGWDVLGVETDQDARTYAKKQGVEVIPPSELMTIPDHSVDAVTLWHSLEHIHALKDTLAACKRILRDDGTLIVAVPNIASDEAKKYGAFWAGLDVPLHLYHFTPRSIRIVLAAAGFSVVRTGFGWTDASILCVLSERQRQGSSVLGILRGMWLTLLSCFCPERAGSPIFIANHADSVHPSRLCGAILDI